MSQLIFIPLPTETHTNETHLLVALSAFALLKVGGQLAIPEPELRALTRDFSGYSVVFDAKVDSYILTLRTRPEEFPPPEFTNLTSA